MCLCTEFELVLFFNGQTARALKAAHVGPVNIATFVEVPFAPGAGFKPEHGLHGLLANLRLPLLVSALLIRVGDNTYAFHG